MNPEPLNKQKIKTTLEIKRLKQGSLDNEHRFGSIKWVKLRDIKSACDFYLKYKNRAKKFITDFPEYAENIVLIVGVYADEKRMADYNEWLFKLAFKDVFEGD